MSASANDDSTITFTVTTANLAPIDNTTAQWLLDRANAQIDQENARRAELEPPSEQLPRYTDINVYLQDVLVRAWRVGAGSYVMQCNSEELETAAAAAPRSQQIDAENVLKGDAQAVPSASEIKRR